MFKWLRKTSLWIVAVPMICFLLGALSNQTVLVANHDRFPVMINGYKQNQYQLYLQKELNECMAANTSDDSDGPDPQGECDKVEFALEGLKYGYLDDTHVIMTSHTHLNFLADWFDRKDGIYSPGDFLLILAESTFEYTLAMWLAVVIMKLQKKEE